MKIKSLLFALTFVLIMSLLSGSVFAENHTVLDEAESILDEDLSIFDENAQEIISINAAGLLMGSVSINYEKVMDASRSYIIGGGLYPGYSVYNIIGGLKYYKENNAPEGFYYGPNGGLILSSDFVGGSIGGFAGYQWLLEEGFTVDLNGGVSIFMGDTSSSVYQNAPFTGVGPTLGINLGYVF